MATSIETFKGKTSRRSHRKSRLGCNNCKVRRIKCDETRPQCVNCLRHSVECTYSQVHVCPNRPASPKRTAVSDAGSESLPRNKSSFISSFQSEFKIPKRAHKEIDLSTTPSPSSSNAESAIAQRVFEFTITDMALLHHIFSAEELKPHVPDPLVRIGFSAHYLLRLLLAFSAFHLSRKTSSSHQFPGMPIDFSFEAERHLSVAIAEVAATGPHLHQGNSRALYLSSLYIFICSLARGPQTGEYLSFRNDNDTPYLSLFLGIRSILEASHRLGISRGFSELHQGESQDSPMEQETEAEHDKGNLISHDPRQTSTKCEFRAPLQQLRHLVLNKFPTHNHRHLTYCDALESLCSRYENILGVPCLSGADLWPQIFGWLYTLPDIFVEDMRNKNHLALLMFSYFLVLLNKLDSVWFIRQWPRHIAIGVYQNLDEHHRTFARWPLRQLGLL